jgi:integrase
MGRPPKGRPDRPWRPQTCSVRAPARKVTRVRARGGAPAKERPSWDVIWLIDGRRYFTRFDRAGEADRFADDLRLGHVRGWLFDPVGKRFVDPATVDLIAAGSSEGWDAGGGGPTAAGGAARDRSAAGDGTAADGSRTGRSLAGGGGAAAGDLAAGGSATGRSAAAGGSATGGPAAGRSAAGGATGGDPTAARSAAAGRSATSAGSWTGGASGAVSARAEETVATWTQRYWDRKWPAIEPQGRREMARYLNRARRHLVDEAPQGEDARALDAYLRTASLDVAGKPPKGEAVEGAAWLAAHSLPMSAVGRVELDGLVERYSVSAKDPTKRLSASTVRRMVADLKQCWSWAVLDDVIEANPWDKVNIDGRSRARARGSRSGGPLAADAELVLSPAQVWELAEACVTEGTWGDSVRGFVLVMGFCGLRPSEACGVVVGDLELPESGAGWLTVRRSRRKLSDRYLEPDDDPEWGPLKGRGVAEKRRVPIPAQVVAALRDHLAAHCAGAGPVDLVFHRGGKAFDLANFQRAAWQPARATLFPPVEGLAPDSPMQSKLSRLRRHDLRHSACSMWLSANVDVTVCQRWSGHKQLSVFLDIYQGLIPGREEDGVRRLEEMLAGR